MRVARGTANTMTGDTDLLGVTVVTRHAAQQVATGRACMTKRGERVQPPWRVRTAGRDTSADAARRVTAIAKRHAVALNTSPALKISLHAMTGKKVTAVHELALHRRGIPGFERRAGRHKVTIFAVGRLMALGAECGVRTRRDAVAAGKAGLVIIGGNFVDSIALQVGMAEQTSQVAHVVDVTRAQTPFHVGNGWLKGGGAPSVEIAVAIDTSLLCVLVVTCVVKVDAVRAGWIGARVFRRAVAARTAVSLKVVVAGATILLRRQKRPLARRGKGRLFGSSRGGIGRDARLGCAWHRIGVTADAGHPLHDVRAVIKANLIHTLLFLRFTMATRDEQAQAQYDLQTHTTHGCAILQLARSKPRISASARGVRASDTVAPRIQAALGS